MASIFKIRNPKIREGKWFAWDHLASEKVEPELNLGLVVLQQLKPSQKGIPLTSM